MNIYFSDIFNVRPQILEEYGAFNISLINDFPLFVDPFLLFQSNKKEYQELHLYILKYVAFLRDKSINGKIHEGLLEAWFYFPEVKQNWFGYCLHGNGGHGLGKVFALALNRNLNTIFTNFGKENITSSSHLEKVCLVKDGVGRDNISDFTTNLIKEYLLEYTQNFARKYIASTKCKIFSINKVHFNFDSGLWHDAQYYLPVYNDDFVLLTPRDMITKDDTWINKNDLTGDFDNILQSISNEQLRAQINYYYTSKLPMPNLNKTKKKKKITKEDINRAIAAVIDKYPEFIDYYIKYKEDNGDKARSVSNENVLEIQNLFIDKLSEFINHLNNHSTFFEMGKDTLSESYERVMFLKNVIENKDGYRYFYNKGVPIRRENDIQIMFRLTWFASKHDVTREANEGRGPVDFKISSGSNDKTLVEFKLASNSKLKQNLAHQVDIYKKAHDTDKSIKVVIYFSEEEEIKTKNILSELRILNEKYIILIDARNDNKQSASRVRD